MSFNFVYVFVCVRYKEKKTFVGICVCVWGAACCYLKLNILEKWKKKITQGFYLLDIKNLKILFHLNTFLFNAEAISSFFFFQLSYCG